MARFWPRRRATRTTEERVEAVPPPPRPFWPWLLLLLAVVLAGLAASWYFAYRGDTVDADRVPNVVGLQRDAAQRRLDEEEFESEPKPVVSPRPAGTVVAQRPTPGTLYGEGGIVVISVARDPLRIEVPDVTGLRSAEAQARLRSAGLRPRAETIRSRRPRGQVIRQIPDPGTEVPRGSAVVVIASAGEQVVDVPEVVGLSAEAATAQLAQAGFRTRIQRVPGSEPEGTVIAQNPGAGSRAPRGQIVRINVSRGRTQTTTTVVTTTTAPTRSTVPNTVGQDEGTAISTIEGAGFRARVVDRTVTDPGQEGIVIRQAPAAGTTAAPGSTVTITVGRLR
jgi:beta-lactam-binding protein with PASTA domain